MRLRMISLGITSLLLSPWALAIPPVTLSGPTPAIPSQVTATTTMTYTISNYVPQRFPLSISGISSLVQRVAVQNDCGNGLLAGSPTHPSTCQIGVSITPPSSNTNTSIQQNLLVNYGGRVPLSSSISTTAVGHPSHPYIFVTENEYDGNLGGVAGADIICQSEAYQAGSVLPSGYQFKALLVSPSRFPCDATGACGDTHSLDWPLFAGQNALNPDNSFFNQVNSNFVFDGSVTSLMTPLGLIDNTSNIWNGTQSVLTNTAATDIVAWAFADVNPSQDSVSYATNLATCNNWSSSDGTLFNGSNGILGQNSAVTGTIPGSTWGNYFQFSDASSSFIENMWSIGNNQTCDTPLKLVCVST